MFPEFTITVVVYNPFNISKFIFSADICWHNCLW